MLDAACVFNVFNPAFTPFSLSFIASNPASWAFVVWATALSIAVPICFDIACFSASDIDILESAFWIASFSSVVNVSSARISFFMLAIFFSIVLSIAEDTAELTPVFNPSANLLFAFSITCSFIVSTSWSFPAIIWSIPADNVLLLSSNEETACSFPADTPVCNEFNPSLKSLAPLFNLFAPFFIVLMFEFTESIPSSILL